MGTQEPLGDSFIFDPDRSVGFDDVGGGDYRVVVALEPGGATTFLLYSPAECQALQSIPIPETPPHEKLGPLPANFQSRTDATVGSRCGRPTRTGKLCQAKVAEPGLACRWHRDSHAT
jgi:hypothetical protein